jgi:hypothetical protein
MWFEYMQFEIGSMLGSFKCRNKIDGSVSCVEYLHCHRVTTQLQLINIIIIIIIIIPLIYIHNPGSLEFISKSENETK